MLRTCLVLRIGVREGAPNYQRAMRRKMQLEQRRIAESATNLPPVEPTPQQAVLLYRQLLKEGKRTIELTDFETYRRKVRYEFEVIARQTSSRVRGIMFEKGKWMLKNKLGGIV